MPAKQGSCPKVKNAGKGRGIQPGDKVVNRTGGRKPQPREITSPARVTGIRNAVRRHMVEHLQLQGFEITSGTAQDLYINGLVSIGGHMPDFGHVAEVLTRTDPKCVTAIQGAFVFGYKLVADAPLVSMLGTAMPFFNTAMAKLEQNRAESQRNRRPSKRHNAPANDMAQKLVAAGHSNGSRANVANRVAKAGNPN